MIVFRFLLSVLLLGLPPLCGRAAEVAPFERLAHVDCFAFGSVAIGAQISDGEKDFRSLLGGPTPLENFRSLLEVGSPEAKCYAMVGLRRLDRQAFDRYFLLLKENGTVVNTRQGCIVSKQSFGDIMKDIASDKWGWGLATKEAAH